jgi:hypothetical protein
MHHQKRHAGRIWSKMQPVIIDIRNDSKIKIEKSVGEERLSGLALMNIHNGEVNFDIDKLCELFISKHPRRMFHANLFT